MLPLDSGTDNQSKNVLLRYEFFYRHQILIPKHKARNFLIGLFFPLVLGAKIAKGKENIPALYACTLKYIAVNVAAMVKTPNPGYYLYNYLSKTNLK